MELWIRSQDKEKLILVKGFELQRAGDNCQIFAVWQNNYQSVGKYETKQRAKEILDEIQEILEQILDPALTILPVFVYEMPKE